MPIGVQDGLRAQAEHAKDQQQAFDRLHCCASKFARLKIVVAVPAATGQLGHRCRNEIRRYQLTP
jgi:hypothetical protein